MNRIIKLVFLGVILFTQTTKAEYVVQALPKTTSAGITSNDAAYLSFQMTNEAEDIIGIEFKVKLPDGMDFDNSDPVNCPPFELTKDPRFPYTGRTDRTYQHSINFSKRDDGYWYVIISSSQLNPIKGLSGEILKGYFITDANMEPGIYPIIVKETILGKSGTVKAETAEIASSYVVIGESKSPATATDVDLSGMTGYVPSFVVEQLNTDIAGNTNLRSLNLSGTTLSNLGAELSVPNNDNLLWYTADKATLNRTFKADQWNTVCLPFTLQTSYLNASTVVKEMTAYDGDATITLGDVSTMEAGKPYLIYTSTGGELIKDVTISNPVPVSTEPGTTTSSGLTMRGTYQEATVKSDGGYTRYGFTGGKFVTLGTGAATVHPFRAYLEILGKSSTRSIGFAGDGTTGINSTVSDGESDGPLYDLKGVMVNENQQTKGIYVRNGKKQIFK